jgi:hypothetical protein
MLSVAFAVVATFSVQVKVRTHDATLRTTLPAMAKLLRVPTSEIVARSVAAKVATCDPL